MKKYKIFDKEKFDWAMDSALDALYREGYLRGMEARHYRDYGLEG